MKSFLILTYLVLVSTIGLYSQSIVPDTSFHTKGYITRDISSESESTRQAISLQDGSKLILANVVQNSVHHAKLIRILPNGEIDTEFNETGSYVLSATIRNAAVGFLIDKSGKIVLAIQMQFGTPLTYPVLCRLNPNGTPDASFHSGGILELHLNAETRGTSITRDEKNNIFMCGLYRYNGSQWESVLIKLDHTGLLCQSFGTNGEVHIPVGSIEETPQKLLVDSSGNIFVFGNSDENATGNSERTYLISKLDSNGNKDLSFNGTGSLNFAIGENGTLDFISEAILDPSGKLLVVCNVRGYTNGPPRMALARITANGSPDETFNHTGYWRSNLDVPSDAITKIIVDSTGKIWTGGYIRNLSGNYTAFLARMNQDGSLDNTFDEDGIYLLPITESLTTDFNIQGNLITVFGNINSATNPEIFIARFNVLMKKKPTVKIDLQENVICSQIPLELTAISNSSGTIDWEVTSGKGEIYNGNLYVNGKGKLNISFHQNADSVFLEYDTSMTLQSRCDLLIYQYISPNDDNENDFFFIENIEFYPDNKISIINKYQSVVKTFSGYRNEWIPKQLAEGTYYYLIETGDEDEIIKGSFLINK